MGQQKSLGMECGNCLCVNVIQDLISVYWGTLDFPLLSINNHYACLGDVTDSLEDETKINEHSTPLLKPKIGKLTNKTLPTVGKKLSKTNTKCAQAYICSGNKLYQFQQ